MGLMSKETKSQPPGMRFIRSHIHAKHYRLTKHATIVRLERGTSLAEMGRVLLHGEIIERYADAQPYPACLVLGWLESVDPLHVVCSRGDMEPALRIVTLYEPEEALWESDYKTRKRKK
jgi:hypothetical protein